jgi:O-succinylbenzoic acid--CoA ligase
MFCIPFSSRSHEELLEEAQATLRQENLSDWQRDIWTFTEAFLNPANSHFSIFTSGTTGKPKLIKHSRHQLQTSALATICFFNLQPGQRALLAIPAAKIGGRMMIVRSILAQLDLYCIPLSSRPLSAIGAGEYFDFVPLTPMQLMNSIQEQASLKKLSNIKVILLGGGEVSNVLLQKVQPLSTAVFHSYGTTETASHIAIRKLNGKDKYSFYQTLPGITVETDSRGCLVISTPQFTREKIITNDLAEVISPTTFQWLGRIDNAINSGGIKLFAEVIEQKLHQLPFRFFIASEKDDLLGEKVIMAIESKPLEDKALKKLTTLMGSLLNKYERPKKIYFIHKFRETENGKVLRQESLLHSVKAIDIIL